MPAGGGTMSKVRGASRRCRARHEGARSQAPPAGPGSRAYPRHNHLSSTITAMSGAVAAIRPGQRSRTAPPAAVVMLLLAGLLGMHAIDSHGAADHAGPQTGALRTIDGVADTNLSSVRTAVTVAVPLAVRDTGSHRGLAAVCLGLLLLAAALACWHRACRPCRRQSTHRSTARTQPSPGRPREAPSLVSMSVARC